MEAENKRSEKKKRKSRRQRSAVGGLRQLLTVGFIVLIIVVILLVAYTVNNTDGVGVGYGEYVTEVTTVPTSEIATEASQPIATTETEPKELTAQERAAEHLQQMSLEEKVYQMLLGTPYTLTKTGMLKEANETLLSSMAEQPVGGLIFTDGNITDAEQVSEMISVLGEDAKLLPFFCADEDAEKKLNTPTVEELTAMGLTLHFQSLETVTDVPNFPAFCIVDFPGEATTQEELAPYRELIADNVPMISVKIGTANGFTDVIGSADLQPEIVTDLLRTELGFSGVIRSGAFTYRSTNSAIKAISAGCDMIYLPDDPKATAEEIIKAVEDGTLTEERINESVLRILTLKYEHGFLE